MRRSVLTLTMAATTGLFLGGCGLAGTTGGSASTSPESQASGSSPSSLTGTVTVFAAASLKEAFTKVGQQFEALHPSVKVMFNFGPSSGLATQIAQGAPADVFASASTKNMGQVVTAGKAVSPKKFVSNVMEIAVPPKNPANITQLSDLAKPGVKVALCQPAVPCGATAAKVFTNARLPPPPVPQAHGHTALHTDAALG